MKTEEMKENIEVVVVKYFDKRGFEVLRLDNHGKTRISIVAEHPNDTHHIEFDSQVSRYQLSGLLINLSKRLAEGV